MTTINQINANRDNSQLSTGPATEEGKQKIKNLVEILESHDDVQKVITNCHESR